MTVIADSGPLIALAKVGGLESLFSVYPEITVGFIEGSTSLDRALELLDSIRLRRDVWISSDLCQQVKSTLLRAAGPSLS